MGKQEGEDNHQADAQFVALGQVAGVIQRADLFDLQKLNLTQQVHSLPHFDDPNLEEEQLVERLADVIRPIFFDLGLSNQDNGEFPGSITFSKLTLKEREQIVLNYLFSIGQGARELVQELKLKVANLESDFKKQQTSYRGFLEDLEDILGIDKGEDNKDDDRETVIRQGIESLSDDLRCGVAATLAVMNTTYNQLTPADQNKIIDEIAHLQPDANKVDLDYQLGSLKNF